MTESISETGIGSSKNSGEIPILRVVLGRRLRRIRESRGVTRTVAAQAINASDSEVFRLELGRSAVGRKEIDILLSKYRVTDPGERAAYLTLASAVSASSCWHEDTSQLPRLLDVYLGLEPSAKLIRCYEPGTVPDLLQTADYARAGLTLAHPHESNEVIDKRVTQLLRRQRILTRRKPARLWAVIEEAAVTRRLGGSTVWQAQLDHLRRAVEQPNITVQILPDHASAPAFAGGPFTVLRFADPDLPDVVHLRHLTHTLYLHNHRDLDAYLDVADKLAAHALQPENTAEVLTVLQARQPATLDYQTKTDEREKQFSMDAQERA